MVKKYRTHRDLICQLLFGMLHENYNDDGTIADGNRPASYVLMVTLKMQVFRHNSYEKCNSNSIIHMKNAIVTALFI